jgi:hypothetical protein
MSRVEQHPTNEKDSWFMIRSMAYEIFALTHNRIAVRCAPGSVVHIAFSGEDDTWTVEEDPDHQTFHTRGAALNRARIIGKDPDFA